MGEDAELAMRGRTDAMDGRETFIRIKRNIMESVELSATILKMARDRSSDPVGEIGVHIPSLVEAGIRKSGHTPRSDGCHVTGNGRDFAACVARLD